MPKYCGKQIFAHGRFPEVGQKQNTERKKEGRKTSENQFFFVKKKKKIT